MYGILAVNLSIELKGPRSVRSYISVTRCGTHSSIQGKMLALEKVIIYALASSLWIDISSAIAPLPEENMNVVS